MKYRSAFYILVPLVLASCGGGGGGGEPSTPSIPSASITMSISSPEIYLADDVTITWSTTNATSCTASGDWSGAKSLSGTETLSFTTSGQKNFTLTCQNSAGNETSRSVTTNVIGNVDGVVVGINNISNANVALDLNNNYQIDEGEPTSTSDINGVFELPDDPQDLVSFSGSDDLSGTLFSNISLSSKPSSNSPKVISSLTSIDYANSGSNDLNTLLSIDQEIDIYSVNPIANLNSSSELDKYYEVNAQLFILAYSMQAFVNETNSLSLDSSSFFEYLYVLIQQYYDTGQPNLSEYIETSEFINAYVDTALIENSIESENISAFKEMLLAMIKKISVRNNSTATSAIGNYATSTFIDDTLSLANGTADLDRISSYSLDINSLIASDQNIDSSILDQSITLEDDSVVTNEDNSVEFPPLSNDSIEVGNDYYGLVILISEQPANGTASIDGSNIITYSPDENFYGDDSFSYSVNVDGSSAIANVSVEVVSVNDPPVFVDFISTTSIDENTLTVLTVATEDVEDDSIGYSLSGTDADKLSISTSGIVSFKSNPDFETPNDSNSDNNYELNIEASDGTDTVSESLIITVLDVENEGNPIIEGLSSQSFDENSLIEIGFTVTDPQNDSISFELTGIDKDLFTLNFDGLNALLTSSEKDYESPEDSDSNNVYLVIVNFSDDLNTTSQEIEITVSNVNDNSPIITSESSFSVQENQTSIATITATDADNDDLNFSLSGTDSGLVEISSSGVLSFVTAPDYETKNTYSLNVQVTDGINTASQSITINVTNVNESPIWNITDAVAFEYQENTSNVEEIDIPEDVYDVDGDNLSFSLTGVDAAVFTISNNIVSFNGQPDYENPLDSDQDNIYLLNVVASDGNLTSTSPDFSVTILNINDNDPVFIDLSESVEVTNGQINVFDVTTNDADGDEVSLTVLGTDGALFEITNTNTLSFIVAPDYSNPADEDGDNIYKINLRASDGERDLISNEISITVLEVNNPPVISGLESSYTLDENIEDIASFTVSDPENNTLTVGVSGDDATNFVVVENVLKYSGGANFENPTDSNADNVYELIVFADDGFNTTTQNVQLTINNVEEGPEFNITEEISIEENVRLISSISIIDPENDSFTWSITGGDDSGIVSLVNVSGGDGDLRFNSFQGVDYENPSDADSDNVYLVQLTATEDKTNGLSTILNLQITITDIKDTWRISGTLLSNPYTLIDGDVPDIVNYPPVPNNDLNSAQTVLNPTDVIGRVGDNVEEVVVIGEDGFCVEDPDNPGFCLTEEVQNIDPEDWYSFSGAPNLLLTLSVEGLIFEEDGSFYCCEYDSMDIDLLIYNEDGTLADFTYTSNSNSIFKQIVIPSSGNYYAVVKSITGTSKYVLTLGSNIFGVSTLSNPKNQFAENRFISYIPFGKDFDINTYTRPNYDRTLNDLNAKMMESSNILSEGLRVLDFNLDEEFNKIFTDNYLSDSSNTSQVNYLKHWKLLQHYKNLYPKLNLELDFKAKAHLTKDPAWPFQWGLAQIGLDSVLSTIGADVKDVAVAVLDTGSPATTSTAWTTSAFLDGGYDFVPFNNAGDGDGYDSDPTDSEAATDSHGTHVATTISALNDGLNINGFGIHTVPIRVLGRDGTGFRSDIVEGLLYAAGLPNASNTIYQGSIPIKVVNMSLGSTGGSCGSTYQNVINDVYDRGITIVSSSGNEAQEAPGFYGYPASCNNVISVAATDYLRNRAYYSTYNDQVDIAAPGGDLTADLSADGYADGILAFDTNEDLSFLQGTSMASPHAAGAIAVLYSLVPTLQPFQIDGLLADGYLTDDVGDEGKDDEFGYGALNLQKAVNRIISDEGLDFTYATIDTSTFNMGVEVDNFDFNITKVGDGELSVISIESDIASAFNVTSSNADAEGFGTYTVDLDRSQIPDGLYQSSITVSFSNENSVVISISFQVGADRERISIPTVYLSLKNDLDERIIGGTLPMDDGGVGFYVDDIPPGNYYWEFSTVIDSFYLDPAEFFNYYPDLSNSNEYFVLGENDIENTSVTLRVNKSTGGLSTNKILPMVKKAIKVEDFKDQKLNIVD